MGTGPKGIQAPVVLVNSFEELELKKSQSERKDRFL